MMIKESINQEDITFVNIYACYIREHECIKYIFTDLKENMVSVQY